ncbi:MAG: DUF3461 family protein [Gammaproteobacteria bacterium]|nr:DUF3461 family protein [Gammaproteobacteria bacterium]MBT8437834.1 DUF3461 family protein [Gammaproteobacteria bacterium]
MSDYPKLTEMGIKHPEEIEKFAIYTVGRTDILRIIYDRKKGSLLPVSRRYKFPQIKKSVLVDSGTRQTETLFESSPAFREALHELETLKAARDKGQDLVAMISEEIKHLEEDIALRAQYIQALLDKL